MCFILKKIFPVYICSILLAWSRGVSGCGSLAWLLCTELSERTHHLRARGGFSPFCQTRCRAWLLLLLPGVSSIEKSRECNSACDQLGRRQPRENSWEEFRGGGSERAKVEFISCTLHFTPCGRGVASCAASISWWPSKNSKWKATISK